MLFSCYSIIQFQIPFLTYSSPNHSFCYIVILITTMLLILMTLALCFPFTTPMAFTQTWDSYLRTGTINSKTATYSATYNYTISLSPPMNSSTYSCAMGLSALFQDNLSTLKYNYFFTDLTVKAATSLTVRLYHSETVLTNPFINVRYLLVQPNFPYLTIFNFYRSFSPYYYYYSRTGPNPSITTTAPAGRTLNPTNDYLIHVINFYWVYNSDTTSQAVSMQSHCWIASSAAVTCIITSPLPTAQFYATDWGVDFVVVHYQKMRDSFGGNVWTTDMVSVSGAAINHVQNLPNTTTDNKLFYGLKYINKNTVTSTAFDYNVTSNSTALNVRFGTVTQNLTIFYLIFNPVTVQCSNQTVWNATTVQCQGCLVGQYFNLNGSCVDCSTIHTDCLECSSAGCSNCSGVMVLYGGTCASCDQIWNNCSQCTENQCLNCTTPFLFRSGSCLTCGQVMSGCLTCNDTTCLSCDSNHFPSGLSCLPCSQKLPNCLQCNSATCFNCSGQYKIDTSGTECFLCRDRWTGCSQCTAAAGCSDCLHPYMINGSVCVGNCTLSQYCQSCYVDNWHLKCLQCDPGYKVSPEFICVADCGDGLLMAEEQCDDGDTRNMDGCSSSCQVQDYFSCDNLILPSFCTLIEMNTSLVCMAKTENKNQIVVTLEISPRGVVYYDEAQWTNAFSSAHHLLNVSWAKYDTESGRLRVGFQYTSILKGVSITIGSELNNASGNFNLSAVSFSLPSTAKNNQALYVYEDSTYSLASMVQYGSYLIGGISIFMLILGYFGCKLQSLEGIAVIQVSALLLMTVEQMGPTYNGLKFLKISLGITPIFSDSYYYQDSTVPTHLNTILTAKDSISDINILLIVFFVPILVGVIIMILNKVKYPQNFRMERVWRYAFGTFTFYGLLFLSYGEFSSLFLNIRYFSSDTSTFMGIAAGAFFALLMLIWLVAFCKYTVWLGSFKNRFYIFQLPRFFYFISACERILTALVIVCLSPGFIACSIVGGIFVAEVLFIACKRPYGMGEWKRPLFNKIVASLVSFLYVGASMTGTESSINQLIPMAIIGLLLSVIIVALIASVFALKEHCASHAEKMKADGSKFAAPLKVDQANKLLLKDFQMKMMPSMITQNHPIWQPVQHDTIDIDKWKWQQYPILNSTEVPLRVRMKREVEKMRKKDGEEEESQSGFLMNLRKINAEKGGKNTDETYGQI